MFWVETHAEARGQPLLEPEILEKKVDVQRLADTLRHR